MSYFYKTSRITNIVSTKQVLLNLKLKNYKNSSENHFNYFKRHVRNAKFRLFWNRCYFKRENYNKSRIHVSIVYNQQSLQLQLNEITVKRESAQHGQAFLQETRTWSG